MATTPKDNPGVIAPPPLIYAGTLAAGLLLHMLFPVRFLPRKIAPILGGVLLGIPAVLLPLAFRTMIRAHTNVNPELPATTLVTEGPFRMTRNPLYLSLALLYIGISMLINTLWSILLFPILILVMRRGVIDREERYLERKFGEQYREYKGSVRRWI